MKRSVQSILGVTTVGLLALTACGGDSNGSGDSTEAANGGSTSAANGGAGDETITLGFIPGWSDGLSTTYVWQAILEDEGYDVEIEDGISEPGVLFAALAQGDVDVYPSAWLPETHGSYMDGNEGDVVDLGSYYDGAVLTLAVPEYTDINSIDELNASAGDLENRIVGIEAGAGHMLTTSGTVMPEYELTDNFSLVESSTAAMLAELDSAIENQEDIVVTLWRPFWPYGEYELKDLEDPMGAYGEPESLSVVANSEFAATHSEVAEWMEAFELDDEAYAELEDMMVNEYEDNEEEGAQAWLEANRDYVDSIVGAE